MGLRTNIEDRIVPSFLQERLQGVPAWRVAGLAMAVGLVALFTLYQHTVARLIETWSGSASYNHCFLIPPVSLYLIWRNRTQLFSVTPRPSALGIVVIAVVGAAWIVGNVSSVEFVEELAFVAMIFGLHLAVFGMAATRINFFPLAYLVLAVPMGAFLIPPLQDITAHAAVALLRLVGVSVFMEGTYITIPNGTYYVAEACAGLRYLTATVTLGVLFGYLYYRSPWRWLAFMALSVVVPVVANGIRAFGVILVGYYTSTKVAGGFDHIVTAWIFLSLVTLGYLAIGYSFSDRKGGPDAMPLPRVDIGTLAPHQALVAVLVAMVVAIIPPAYADHVRAVTSRVNLYPLINPPKVTAPWVPVEKAQTEWLPKYAGLDSSVANSYRSSDGSQVDLFIGFYACQREDSELLAYGNTVADPQVWRVVNDDSVSASLGGRDTVVAEIQLTHGSVQRLVRYWYWVDGKFTVNPYWAKLLFAQSKLFGGIQGAAVVAVSTPYSVDVTAAQARIDDFMAHVEPIGDVLMNANGRPKG
jgi:exosortase A